MERYIIEVIDGKYAKGSFGFFYGTISLTSNVEEANLYSSLDRAKSQVSYILDTFKGFNSDNNIKWIRQVKAVTSKIQPRILEVEVKVTVKKPIVEVRDVQKQVKSNLKLLRHKVHQELKLKLPLRFKDEREKIETWIKILATQLEKEYYPLLKYCKQSGKACGDAIWEEHIAGCCHTCANDKGWFSNFEDELVELYNIKQFWVNDKDGYFNKETMSCNIPRWLRSYICLDYICPKHIDKVKDKTIHTLTRLIYLLRRFLIVWLKSKNSEKLTSADYTVLDSTYNGLG